MCVHNSFEESWKQNQNKKSQTVSYALYVTYVFTLNCFAFIWLQINMEQIMCFNINCANDSSSCDKCAGVVTNNTKLCVDSWKFFEIYNMYRASGMVLSEWNHIPVLYLVI